MRLRLRSLPFICVTGGKGYAHAFTHLFRALSPEPVSTPGLQAAKSTMQRGYRKTSTGGSSLTRTVSSGRTFKTKM